MTVCTAAPAPDLTRPRASRVRVVFTMGAVALVAACLQGCVTQLLQSDVPASETYRLSATSVAPPASPSAASPGVAITVARPRASLALDTDRIAVAPGSSRFDHYSGVQWAVPAPQMLQENLVAALQSSGRFAAVFAAPARVPTELALDVELRHFEAVAPSPEAAPEVQVQVQATLLDARRAARLTSFVSEARVPAASNRRAAIIEAFEKANRQVVGDVTDRVGTALAAFPAGPPTAPAPPKP